MPNQGHYRRMHRATPPVVRGPGIFRVATTGSTGISDALAAAALPEARGGPLDGDVFVTGDTGYDHVILAGDLGSHQVPFALGTVERDLATGFVAKDPVAAGLAAWSYGASAGAYTHTVDGGQLVLTASATGAQSEIRWSPGQLDRPYHMILDGMEATGGTASAVITLFTGSTLGRYTEIRNQSNIWEIRTTGAAWTSMGGQSTLTPARLELRFQPTGPYITYRWGSSGLWVPLSANPAVLLSTVVFRMYAKYVSGAGVLKTASVFVSPTD